MKKVPEVNGNPMASSFNEGLIYSKEILTIRDYDHQDI
jgi:hypothetical protein